MDRTIQFTLTQEQLSNDDNKYLEEFLGDSSKLNQIAKAAFMEYMQMLTKDGFPSRLDEARQSRLLLLIEHFFDNKIPDEDKISCIFKLTPSQSKTLIQNTKSKYRVKISNSLNETLKELFQAFKEENDQYELECKSKELIKELNSRLGAGKSQIKEKKDSKNKYICSEDSYRDLKSKLLDEVT